MKAPLVSLVPLAFGALVGCTAAQRTIAAGIINDATTVAPLFCQYIAPSSSACSEGVGIGSAAATIIARILGTVGAKVGAGTAEPMSTFVWHTVVITVPTSRLAEVQAALAAAAVKP